MNRLLACILTMLALLMISCSDLVSQSETDPKADALMAASDKDRKAIETAYQNWYTAWETKDQKLAARDYSDDAFWVNAFGMKRTGRAEIEKALEEVFALDFVMAGKSKTVEKTVRFIAPNVALVESRVERDGQETQSGEQLGTRKTTHLRVFAKSNGRWQIISHLISDARSTERKDH